MPQRVAAADTAKTEPATVDVEQLRETIRQAEVGFIRAGMAHEKERFESTIDPEAIYLDERVVHGRAGWVSTWAPLFDPVKEVSLEWEPLEVEVASSGELAYSIGRGTIRWRKLGNDEFNEIAGHYLSIWRRNAEGEWKIWMNGTLVLHDDPELGVSTDPRFTLADAWKWEVLGSPGADTEISWKTEKTAAPASGEFAVSFGSFKVEASEGEKKDVGVGHFVEVRSKNDIGRWRLVAGAYTAPLPPAG